MNGLALEYLNKNLPNMTMEIDNELMNFSEWMEAHPDKVQDNVLEFLREYSSGEYNSLVMLILADLAYSAENRRPSDKFDELMYTIWEEDWKDFD